MSATLTRSDRQEPFESALPLEEGVRVLACIGKQEGLRALLAFSDLRENTRQRRPASGSLSARNLPQNERLVLHEVLQLLCMRAQALTQADSVMIALAEGTEFVCRASAGSRPIPQGIRLNRESKFLGEALESGKILRCDDSGTDARIQLDFARALEARSTILVPLRGRSEHLGVLQAFSATPWAFTDYDVCCLDLFAELLLAALKPADQDRRLHWLGDVAGELLQKKATAIESATPEPAMTAHCVAEPAVEPAAVEPAEVEPSGVNPDALVRAINQLLTTSTAPAHVQRASIEIAQIEAAKPEVPGLRLARIELASEEPAKREPAKTWSAASGLAKAESFADQPAAFSKQLEPFADQDAKVAISAAFQGLAPRMLPDLGKLTEPIVIPVDIFDSRKPESEETGLETFLTSDAEHLDELPLSRPKELYPTPSIPRYVFLPLTSRPGLSVVLALVVVAALFSAGVWWGMQAHTSYAPARIAAAPKSVTTPAAPDDLTLSVGNDAIAPTPASGGEPPTPVPETKLAQLPKITSVRHWSSSMGSTVVIDMEDQVNYEVHRLMSPERIYFDLHDTALPADLDGKTMDVGDASLASVRIAQPVAGITRIVLDTKNGSNFSVSMETNPYRLVVELRDSAKSLAASRLVHTAPAAKPATTAPLTATTKPSTQLPARTGTFRIVLDAGHGGWDLGTVGRQGLLEKDLVLDVTRRIGKLLQSRNGAEVMFTRTGDDYVALDQRADFANQAQADLFVSVHANYSHSITARGVETYYTNLFSTPGLKEIEKRADGTFAQPSPVTLSADGLHEKIEESRRLAASVQRSLYATLAAKSPDIRDRGIKDASFVVLTGTTMPAILTEISFVSSPADEHNLQSDGYRQQIAEAIYKGIAQYEESFPKAKVAQLRPAATGR